MSDGVNKNERIMSLLIHLAHNEFPSSRARIEEAVEGYAGLGSGDPSAEKTLCRDIETLNNIGVKVTLDDNRISLDTLETYTQEVELSPREIARLSIIGTAPLGDPSFIYHDELLSALMKLSGGLHESSSTLQVSMDCAVTPLSAASSSRSGSVKKLEECREKRKTVTFTYTKESGASSHRTVDPLGLFSIKDDWYLIGWDRDREDLREFRLDRMSAIRQKSQSVGADFEPRDFDLQNYIHFPFFFGDEEAFDAAFIIPAYTSFEPDYLWDDAQMFRIEGMDDSLLMVVQARSVRSCAKWALAHSPQTVPVHPAKVVDCYLGGLERVMAAADPLASPQDGDSPESAPGGGGTQAAEPSPSRMSSPKKGRRAGRPDGTAETQRLLSLYTYLEQQGLFDQPEHPTDLNRIPISQVASFFGYTEDTVCDLAGKLACCGYDFYLLPLVIQGEYIYSSQFDGFPHALRLSRGECKALVNALEMAAIPKDDPLCTKLLERAGTPDFNLSSFSNYLPDADEVPESSLESTLATVINALEDHRVLTFSYRKRGDKSARPRQVEPISLILDAGKWYLFAWCLSRNAPRTFSLENMRFANATERRFTPRDVTPERFSEKLTGKMPAAVLRFSDGRLFVRREWPGAFIEDAAEDGTLKVTVPYEASSAWMPIQVMSNLGDVTVIEPSTLRERSALLARERRSAATGTLRRWERARKGSLVSLDTSSPCPEGVGSLMEEIRETPFRNLSR